MLLKRSGELPHHRPHHQYARVVSSRAAKQPKTPVRALHSLKLVTFDVEIGASTFQQPPSSVIAKRQEHGSKLH